MFSVLYNIFLQLIYLIYNSWYLLIFYPYIALPHFPLLLVTTSLFSLSVSRFLSCYIHSFISQIPHIRDNIQYLSLPDISLSLIPSSSIYVVENGKISLVFYDRVKFIHAHTHIHITSLSADLLVYLGCFRISTISWLL